MLGLAHARHFLAAAAGAVAFWVKLRTMVTMVFDGEPEMPPTSSMISS